MIALFLGL